MTQAVSVAQYGGNNPSFRNRIINGGMVIDQRNAGASVSVVSGLVFPVDRSQVVVNAATGSTAQRSTTAPTGFTNSLLITVGTGASPAAGNQGRLLQVIEGFNTADLAWGTASAVAVTLSFWVRSSVTGTFAGGLYGGGGSQISYIFTYAISAANTWEYKTVTIPGPTTGTWATDNTAGININFDLGTGTTYQGTAGSWTSGALWATSSSVKLCATTGATFYITGVQLEAGTVATPFEFRDYGRELMMCQRYYQGHYGSGIGTGVGLFGRSYAASGGSSFPIPFTFPVTMRSTPTIGIVGTWTVANAGQPFSSGATVSHPGLVFTSSAGGDVFAYANATSQGFTASSEL